MTPSDPNQVAEEIVAMERAGLARWGRGDPSGFLEICAPEVTYFDPYLDRRVDGLDRLRRYYESLAGKISIDRYELLNPNVQVHGDVAVLTFNYVSYGKADSAAPDARWNCTEVYRSNEGSWRILHTHWSVTQ